MTAEEEQPAITRVQDPRSAFQKIKDNMNGIRTIERELKRGNEARAFLLAEIEELKGFIIESGDEALMQEVQEYLGTRRNLRPDRVPGRPIEEQEILAMLKAKGHRNLSKEELTQEVAQLYGRSVDDVVNSMIKMLNTGEVYLETVEGKEVVKSLVMGAGMRI